MLLSKWPFKTVTAAVVKRGGGGGIYAKYRLPAGVAAQTAPYRTARTCTAPCTAEIFSGLSSEMIR